MYNIKIPEDVSAAYYRIAIKQNLNITLEGFYNGPKDEAYLKSREELKNAFELTYLCDDWLDRYCHQHPGIRHTVPVTAILQHIEKFYKQDIPLGCLLIAIMHRKERYKNNASSGELELLFYKKAYSAYILNEEFNEKQ